MYVKWKFWILVQKSCFSDGSLGFFISSQEQISKRQVNRVISVICQSDISKRHGGRPIWILLIFSLGSVSCGLHVSFFGWEFVFYYMLEFWARIRENHRLYVNDVHRPHDITCLLLGAAIFTHPLLLMWCWTIRQLSIMRWKVQPVPPLGARLWTVGRCQSTWRGPAQVEENMQVLHLKTLN